ncbi:MAG TPA: patatin-like phospholipase family protein [Jatrophihabitans sp.]|nr:patatin-like phospholipase family protein [Jatrophihabitans sp.]
MNPRTAFVFGGGGVLGATQVGMLHALLDRGIAPDLIVGTSVGALNGAMLAADPSPAMVGRLAEVWSSLSRAGVFSDSVVAQVARLAAQRTHLHSTSALRELLAEHLGRRRIEELPVRFECVAASIERSVAHWFATGPVVDAVVASCSVPGLFPPARVPVGDRAEHFYDGGLVHSIPVGRAARLGAERIYVLHVGRIEHPLQPPRWPWQVGMVAFEIARRNRFVEEMAALTGGTTVHVLPSGEPEGRTVNLRYRDMRRVGERIDRARVATAEYLDGAA